MTPPNIDAIAARGTVMQNAVCQSPVCLPSRSSQLCGRYPQEFCCLNNMLQAAGEGCPEGYTSFTSLQQDTGCVTANVGRFHNLDRQAFAQNEVHGDASMTRWDGSWPPWRPRDSWTTPSSSTPPTTARPWGSGRLARKGPSTARSGVCRSSGRGPAMCRKAKFAASRPPIEDIPGFPPHLMRVAVRTARYRMDVNWPISGQCPSPDEADGNLFDLVEDPQERRSRFSDAEMAGTVAELMKRLEDWIRRPPCDPRMVPENANKYF